MRSFRNLLRTNHDHSRIFQIILKPVIAAVGRVTVAITLNRFAYTRDSSTEVILTA